MTDRVKSSVERFGKDLSDQYDRKRFVVFLCGPTLDRENECHASALRRRFKDQLEAEGFEVVLGEDDGLENLRQMYSGMAHENEMQFIESEAQAILLIGDSVGSWCELGLFSYKHVRDKDHQRDFILILNEEFRDHISYLNEGPAKAIETFDGLLVHCNFSAFDISAIIDRLKRRRSVWFTDKRK